jgi:hypothetical protein
MKLSDRIRPDVEAAPWVIEEVKKLEQELADAYLEMRKIKVTAVYDPEVWSRARKAGTSSWMGAMNDE